VSESGARTAALVFIRRCARKYAMARREAFTGYLRAQVDRYDGTLQGAYVMAFISGQIRRDDYILWSGRAARIRGAEVKRSLAPQSRPAAISVAIGSR
jgi:hypothetical protein